MKSSTEPQTALGSVDVLPVQAAQTHRVEADAALLGTDVGRDVKFAARVSVDVTVKTGDTQARLGRLAVVGGVEFLLRKRRQ